MISIPISTAFYLAARFSRRAEMRKVAADLIAAGHSVTSRWIHERAENENRSASYAKRDVADVNACDAVIVFTDEARTTNSRGGHHVEMGLGMGLGKPIVVVGWRENVFHHLPDVTFFPDWPAALAALRPSLKIAA